MVQATLRDSDTQDVDGGARLLDDQAVRIKARIDIQGSCVVVASLYMPLWSVAYRSIATWADFNVSRA